MKNLAFGINKINFKNGNYTVKKCNGYFLCYFLTDCVCFHNANKGVCKSGEYFLTSCDNNVSFTASIYNDVTKFNYLYFNLDDFVSFNKKYSLPLNKPFTVDDGSLLEKAIISLKRQTSYSMIGVEDSLIFTLKDLLLNLYREFLKVKKSKLSLKLEEVKGYIYENYSSDINLNYLAKMCDISKSRFSAVYKEYFNISPINDLINARILNAKLLLTYGDYSVSEVANLVGFSNIYYFSKHFKQKEGVSPTEFVKNNV